MLGMEPTLKNVFRGTWVAQLADRLTSAQVMIAQCTSSSPASGSVLTARSLLQSLNRGVSVEFGRVSEALAVITAEALIPGYWHMCFTVCVLSP